MYGKEIPCIPKLVPTSNQKICFPWGRRSLDSLIVCNLNGGNATRREKFWQREHCYLEAEIP